MTDNNNPKPNDLWTTMQALGHVNVSTEYTLDGECARQRVEWEDNKTLPWRASIPHLVGTPDDSNQMVVAQLFDHGGGHARSRPKRIVGAFLEEDIRSAREVLSGQCPPYHDVVAVDIGQASYHPKLLEVVLEFLGYHSATIVRLDAPRILSSLPPAMGVQTLRMLADTFKHCGLVHVILAHNAMNPDVFRYVMRMIHPTLTRVLDLCDTGMEVAHAEILGSRLDTGIGGINLASLKLSRNNNLGHEGGDKVLASLIKGKPALVELEVASCGFSPAGTKVIVDALRTNKSMHSLDLAYSTLGNGSDPMHAVLSLGPKLLIWKALRDLDLTETDLGENGLLIVSNGVTGAGARLRKFLVRNKAKDAEKLRTLAVDSELTEALVGLLTLGSESLTDLDLSFYFIPDEVCARLFCVLGPKLVNGMLRANDVGAQAAAAITSSQLRPNIIKQLDLFGIHPLSQESAEPVLRTFDVARLNIATAEERNAEQDAEQDAERNAEQDAEQNAEQSVADSDDSSVYSSVGSWASNPPTQWQPDNDGEFATEGAHDDDGNALPVIQQGPPPPVVEIEGMVEHVMEQMQGMGLVAAAAAPFEPVVVPPGGRGGGRGRGGRGGQGRGRGGRGRGGRGRGRGRGRGGQGQGQAAIPREGQPAGPARNLRPRRNTAHYG